MAFKLRVVTGSKVQLLAKGLDDAGHLMNAWGMYLTEAAQRSFTDQRSPDGKAWPARGLPSYGNLIPGLNAGRFDSAWLTSSRPALVQTGRLRNAITYRVPSPKTVEVINPTEYASLMEKGGSRTLQITTTGKANLLATLKLFPALRPKLGWLFRATNVTIDIPARPWTGISQKMREDLMAMAGIFLNRDRPGPIPRPSGKRPG